MMKLINNSKLNHFYHANHLSRMVTRFRNLSFVEKFMTLSHTSKNRLALTAIYLAALMFGLEISSVPVILPTLERVLHSDFSEMQWIMNAYTLACTAVMMATGTLSDRFGRRRVFLIAIVAFRLTSLLCGLANGSTMLIVGRFMQGMAGGAMLICQVAALSHQFQNGKQRGQAFASGRRFSGIGLRLAGDRRRYRGDRQLAVGIFDSCGHRRSDTVTGDFQRARIPRSSGGKTG
ncbi:MFS transporter [Serratia proteamaculans]